MSSLRISTHLIAALGTLIASAPVLADVVFTSEPPTSAAVGRPYTYRMTALITDKDGDQENDKDDDEKKKKQKALVAGEFGSSKNTLSMHTEVLVHAVGELAEVLEEQGILIVVEDIYKV